jgi:hypothetical protein
MGMVTMMTVMMGMVVMMTTNQRGETSPPFGTWSHHCDCFE